MSDEHDPPNGEEPVAADLPPAVVEAAPAVVAIETEERTSFAGWLRALLRRSRKADEP